MLDPKSRPHSSIPAPVTLSGFTGRQEELESFEQAVQLAFEPRYASSSRDPDASSTFSDRPCAPTKVPTISSVNSSAASFTFDESTTNKSPSTTTTTEEAKRQSSRRSAFLIRSTMDLAGAQNGGQDLDASDTDRYGFRKESSFVSIEQYNEWWSEYKVFLARRKRKWVAFMQDSGLSVVGDTPVRFPASSEKLKRYVRKGIPAEWRGNAWFWLAKGHDKLNANAGVYRDLCHTTATLDNRDAELIERDLNRTFPDNIHFRRIPGNDDRASSPTSSPSSPLSNEEEPAMIQALRRVLRAFSVYQPKIGYCQSLNFLAGLLLIFMDEERAFWMLVIVTQKYLPGVHEVSLEGVNVDQGVLMLCVKGTLPKMWPRLAVSFEGHLYPNVITKLPPITLCTAAWFMSGYIGVLPIESVMRVWDCLFLEDSKVFFRVALALLKMAEPATAGIKEQAEVFQIIQRLPRTQLDASALLSMCFKKSGGFGNISQPQINRLRQFVTERRACAPQAALQSEIPFTHDTRRKLLGYRSLTRLSDTESSKSPTVTEFDMSELGSYLCDDIRAYKRSKPRQTGLRSRLSRRDMQPPT